MPHFKNIIMYTYWVYLIFSVFGTSAHLYVVTSFEKTLKYLLFFYQNKLQSKLYPNYCHAGLVVYPFISQNVLWRKNKSILITNGICKSIIYTEDLRIPLMEDILYIFCLL